MWCRTILTAVAISYVICMLLLSGLQKEDLDAGTLEKLGRHNVNIDDMNNEERRQECLLESYSLKGNDTENNVTTEVQTEAYTMSLKRTKNDVNIGTYPKMRMRIAANFADKTLVQNDLNTNKNKGFSDQHTEVVQKMPPSNILPAINEIFNKKKNDLVNIGNLVNTTKVEENNGLQIDYNAQNQPDVESVINFWTKLTHYTKTVVTKLPTTPTMPTFSTEKNVTTTVQIESHNNGYNVHSREMEYISKILSDYLATQTVPTTTQQISTEKVNTNYLPIKYGEIAKKYGIDEELFRLFPTKNNEPVSEKNEIIKKYNLTRDELNSNKDIQSSISDETKSILFRDSKPQIKKIQDTPYSQILRYESKTKESNPVKRNNPIKFLDSLLQMKNEYNMNAEPISFIESTTKIKKTMSNQSYEQEKSETFNQYHLFQNMNIVNNNTSKKYDRILNLMNDQSKSGSIEAETWEPVRSYRPINKQYKVFNKEKDPMQKFGRYNQFNAAPTDTDKVKRLNTLRMNTFSDEPVNKSEQIQNFDVNNNRVKVRLPVVKKTKLNEPPQAENDRFKTLLPSIKNAKHNQNSRTTNALFKLTPDELNKSEQNHNAGDLFKMLAAATDRSRQNRLSKINYDQFNAEPKTIKNIKPHYTKAFNDNQFRNTTPVIKETERIQEDTINEIKTIPERNKYERYNERGIPVKELKRTQNFGSKLFEPQAIPQNIIKEIAEKVKEIVLKDIEKEVTVRPTSSASTTTVVPTTVTSTTVAPTTVTSTTIAPTTVTSTTTTPTTVTTTITTTITTSEKPSTLQKEITEANQVIKKLMEIFKELKAMKPTTMFTSQMPPNTTVSYGTTKLPAMPIQTYPQNNAFNPYIMKGPNIKPMEVNPYPNGMIPIPQNQAVQYLAQFPLQQPHDYHSGAITIQTNSDEIAPLAIQISKPLKLINQHIVVTTKRSVDKIKQELERESKKRIEEKILGPLEARNHREKLKLQSDFSKKVRFEDSLKRHEFRDRYSYKSRFIKDREKPWYNHEYNEKVRHIENTHPVVSRFPDSINYPGSISHLENLNHQRGLSNSEGLSYTGGINRPSFNHEDGLNSLTRIRQPVPYGHSDYDRQPRYEATKFHEKLERIENWPRSTWKEFKALSTDTSCDEISARQQMPLVKVKQRTRFDDTHFTNFLKSQQKVTDMLEKILANNIKNSGPHSVETP